MRVSLSIDPFIYLLQSTSYREGICLEMYAINMEL
jgi:hypothetical protein